MAATEHVADGVRRPPFATQLRKTRLCVYNMRNQCQMGAKCAFAHATDELLSPPDLRKTRLCRWHSNGGCQDADCGFAHGQAELRATDQFFKTTLCRFHKVGRCRSGAQCRFAHGVADLLPRSQEVGSLAAQHRGGPARAQVGDLFAGRRREVFDEPMKVMTPELGKVAAKLPTRPLPALPSVLVPKKGERPSEVWGRCLVAMDATLAVMDPLAWQHGGPQPSHSEGAEVNWELIAELAQGGVVLRV